MARAYVAITSWTSFRSSASLFGGVVVEPRPVAGVSGRVTTSRARTVTDRSAPRPPDTARIVAAPADRAVTVPFDATEATSAFDELHSIVALGIGAPAALRTIALSRVVSP